MCVCVCMCFSLSPSAYHHPDHPSAPVQQGLVFSKRAHFASGGERGAIDVCRFVEERLFIQSACMCVSDDDDAITSVSLFKTITSHQRRGIAHTWKQGLGRLYIYI